MTNSLKLYLQLLEVFTIREIKSRYKASILGPVWLIVYPLATAIILNLVFGTFIKIKTDGVGYFIFIFSALVFWDFFQQSIVLARDSLIWNRDLITKSVFPKEILPLSYVLSKIPDFFVYYLIFLIFYFNSGYPIDFRFIFLSFSILPLFFLSAGISLLMSLSNALFRDFGRLVDFFLMIIFYITPIVYPDRFVPSKFKIILFSNPLSLVIIFARDLLFKAQLHFWFFGKCI